MKQSVKSLQERVDKAPRFGTDFSNMTDAQLDAHIKSLTAKVEKMPYNPEEAELDARIAELQAKINGTYQPAYHYDRNMRGEI